MEVVLAILCVSLVIATPNFLTADNILAILRSVSFQGLIAFGMTMVIIVGEIDLSVGANAAFAGCLVAWLIQARAPVAIAILQPYTGFARRIGDGAVTKKFTWPLAPIVVVTNETLRGAPCEVVDM